MLRRRVQARHARTLPVLWIPAVTEISVAGNLQTFVLWQGQATGWLYEPNRVPVMVSVLEQTASGPTGIAVHVGPAPLAAAQNAGGSPLRPTIAGPIGGVASGSGMLTFGDRRLSPGIPATQFARRINPPVPPAPPASPLNRNWLGLRTMPTSTSMQDCCYDAAAGVLLCANNEALNGMQVALVSTYQEPDGSMSAVVNVPGAGINRYPLCVQPRRRRSFSNPVPDAPDPTGLDRDTRGLDVTAGGSPKPASSSTYYRIIKTTGGWMVYGYSNLVASFGGQQKPIYQSGPYPIQAAADAAGRAWVATQPDLNSGWNPTQPLGTGRLHHSSGRVGVVNFYSKKGGSPTNAPLYVGLHKNFWPADEDPPEAKWVRATYFDTPPTNRLGMSWIQILTLNEPEPFWPAPGGGSPIPIPNPRGNNPDGTLIADMGGPFVADDFVADLGGPGPTGDLVADLGGDTDPLAGCCLVEGEGSYVDAETQTVITTGGVIQCPGGEAQSSLHGRGVPAVTMAFFEDESGNRMVSIETGDATLTMPVCTEEQPPGGGGGGGGGEGSCCYDRTTQTLTCDGDLDGQAATVICPVMLPDGSALVVVQLGDGSQITIPVCPEPPGLCCYDVATGTLRCNNNEALHGQTVSLIAMVSQPDGGVVAVVQIQGSNEQITVPICDDNVPECCFDTETMTLKCPANGDMNGIAAAVIRSWTTSDGKEWVWASWAGGGGRVPLCPGQKCPPTFCCVNVETMRFVCPNAPDINGKVANVVDIVTEEGFNWAVLQSGNRVPLCGRDCPPPEMCPGCPGCPPGLWMSPAGDCVDVPHCDPPGGGGGGGGGGCPPYPGVPVGPLGRVGNPNAASRARNSIISGDGCTPISPYSSACREDIITSGPCGPGRVICGTSYPGDPPICCAAGSPRALAFAAQQRRRRGGPLGRIANPCTATVIGGMNILDCTPDFTSDPCGPGRVTCGSSSPGDPPVCCAAGSPKALAFAAQQRRRRGAMGRPFGMRANPEPGGFPIAWCVDYVGDGGVTVECCREGGEGAPWVCTNTATGELVAASDAARMRRVGKVRRSTARSIDSFVSANGIPITISRVPPESIVGRGRRVSDEPCYSDPGPGRFVLCCDVPGGGEWCIVLTWPVPAGNNDNTGIGNMIASVARNLNRARTGTPDQRRIAAAILGLGRGRRPFGMRANPDVVPKWKNDGHCCEECSLGKSCSGDDCNASTATVRVMNPTTSPRRLRRGPR